jgi:hypothetical protein
MPVIPVNRVVDKKRKIIINRRPRRRRGTRVFCPTVIKRELFTQQAYLHN